MYAENKHYHKSADLARHARGMCGPIGRRRELEELDVAVFALEDDLVADVSLGTRTGRRRERHAASSISAHVRMVSAGRGRTGPARIAKRRLRVHASTTERRRLLSLVGMASRRWAES